MNDLRTAFGLLTILPIRCGDKISARAFAYYPLVGLLIGLTLTTAGFFLRLALPSLVAAALLVVLWAVLTGALHLDGFSDACDGLFAATTREHRLEILRDVHLGAFGAAGLALLLITKVAAVASSPNLAPILLAPVLGRWALVYAAAYPPPARKAWPSCFGRDSRRGSSSSQQRSRHWHVAPRACLDWSPLPSPLRSRPSSPVSPLTG